jgi:transcriptional regulator with PAS, ATPase and Fis domain
MGSDKPEHSDFRIMSATCEDLESMVQRGEFRQDLYYRLMGHGLKIVPLRANREHLIQTIKKTLNSDGKRRLLSSEAWDTLLTYSWPGNYREFYKEIEMLFEKNRGMIQVTDLSPSIMNPLAKNKKSDYLDSLFAEACENGLQETLAKIQQELIQYSFERNDGQVRKTLKELKISSHAFYKMPLRRGAQASKA